MRFKTGGPTDLFQFFELLLFSSGFIRAESLKGKMSEILDIRKCKNNLIGCTVWQQERTSDSNT